jgi:hypothetical protein
MSDTPGRPRGIDPRGPRFAASATTVLLAIAVVLGLTGLSTARFPASFGWFAYQPLAGRAFAPGGVDFAYVAGKEPWSVSIASPLQRALDPGFLLLLVIALLFLWGVLSPRTAPWGVLYRRLIQPRLAPPTELEDPRPPRFAQGVGLFVTTLGLVLHLAGVPWALPIAAGAAFVAAFLNAVFGLCLGCQLYLLLQRAGLIGRGRPATA